MEEIFFQNQLNACEISQNLYVKVFLVIFFPRPIAFSTYAPTHPASSFKVLQSFS